VYDWEVVDAVAARAYDWTLDDEEDEEFALPCSDGVTLAKMGGSRQGGWGKCRSALALASVPAPATASSPMLAPSSASAPVRGQPSDHARRAV
jgi:hypothetical protein